MLREIKTELGFELIELDMVFAFRSCPGIQKMFDSGQVRFSSLHNFCPLPIEVIGAFARLLPVFCRFGGGT